MFIIIKQLTTSNHRFSVNIVSFLAGFCHQTTQN